MTTISALTPLQSVQSRVDIFEQLFLVFLVLGTIVGIVVVTYMLYNAYKYRDTPAAAEEDEKDRPSLGELPTGGGGGKKLFVSFLLSAIIVISLVIWSYTMLLDVEAGPSQPDAEDLEIEIHGFAFGWHFDYVTEDGETVRSTGEVVLPEDTTVWISVTSDDVWHAFGVPEQRVKADALPGEYDETWFHTDELEEGETANYTVECFELCGPGHSNMEADMRIVSQEEYDEWYANLLEEAQDGQGGNGNESDQNATTDGNESIGGDN